MARLEPVDELDAELERAPGRAEERVFVEPERVVEQMDLRDRRLADPDSRNRAKVAAAIQPAVPPPAITIRKG
jgi:hypothetical protein